MASPTEANPSLDPLLPGYDAQNHQTNVAYRAVNITTDSSVTPTVTYGDMAMSPTTGTTGGSTPYHLISAASDNATNLKNAAGQIYDLSISNTAASARYFKLYDKATAPASTDTPKRTIQIPANATVICAYPVGLSFALGIGFRATTGLADADTGSVGASDLSIDLGYK